MNAFRHAAGRRLAPALVLATAAAIVANPMSARSTSADVSKERRAERRLVEPLRTGSTTDALRSSLANAPMRFAENRGQAAKGVAYVAHGPEYRVTVGETSTRIAMGAPDVELTFGHASRVEGIDRQPGTSNYLVGGDRSAWRTGVENFGTVRLSDVAPGVDVSLTGEAGRLSVTWTAKNGATSVAAGTSAERVRIEPSGEAILSTPDGALRLGAPSAYVERAGVRETLPTRFAVDGRGLRLVADGARVAVGARVLFATSVQGEGDVPLSDRDEGWDVTVDAAGNTYVAGATQSSLFPVAGPIQPTHNGGADGFITKLDATGHILYSTFLGGTDGDGVHGIAVDAAGNIYVTGSTASTNFPIANAYQPTNNSGGTFETGSFDAFVSKLTPAGNAFVWSTYLGGERDEDGNSLKIDASGNVAVVGSTNSELFPTVSPLQAVWGGGFCGPFACPDAFAAKLNAAGSALTFSTYLGGFGFDTGEDVALDSAGNVYAAGATSSDDFPISNAVQTTRSGTTDAFATKVTPAGTAFVYSTFIGGTSYDAASGIAVDASGNAYVTGTSVSLDYPVVSPLQTGNGGAYTTTNAAGNWSKVNTGLLPTNGVYHVVVDSTTPTTAYVGSGLGVFKTIDGGATWTDSSNGIQNQYVESLAISASNPAVLYAGTAAGAFVSTNAGGSWSPALTGLPEETPVVTQLEVDPTNPMVVFAYAPAGGIFKTVNGGGSWALMQNGLDFAPLGLDIEIDPTAPNTVYVASFGSVVKTIDGGASWVTLDNGLPFNSIYGIQVDPSNPSTVYAAYLSSGIYKSVDGGASWSQISSDRNISGIITSFEIDPSTPSTLYVGMEGDRVIRFGKAESRSSVVAFSQEAPDRVSPRAAAKQGDGRGTGALTANGGVFKSVDSGATWAPVNAGLTSNSVLDIAVAPSQTSRIYAATVFRGDAVVTKLDPTGATISASTFFGGNDQDQATEIAVDAIGNIYITGATWSLDLPTVGALQPSIGEPLYADGFVTKLASPSGPILASTFVGGGDDDFPAAIAVDALGGPVITGYTYSANYPVFSAHQSMFSGGVIDATVSRLSPGLGSYVYSTYLGGFASVPVVQEVGVQDGGRLGVRGIGFDRGAIVYIDNQRQLTKNAPNNPTTLLFVNKPGTKLLPGTTHRIVVRNANGAVSATFLWTRPTQ